MYAQYKLCELARGLSIVRWFPISLAESLKPVKHDHRTKNTFSYSNNYFLKTKYEQKPRRIEAVRQQKDNQEKTPSTLPRGTSKRILLQLTKQREHISSLETYLPKLMTIYPHLTHHHHEFRSKRCHSLKFHGLCSFLEELLRIYLVC